MRCTRFALIVSCSFLVLSGSAFAQAPPAASPTYPHLVLIDLRDVVESPLSWQSRQWELFGLSVAGIGAVGLLDGRIRDAEARDHNHVVDQVTHYAEQIGYGGAVEILGVFYLASLATGDQRSRWVAEDGVAASIIAGVILDPAIKVVAGRERPRETTRTYDFKLFGGGQSFPSGHATEAFALASVLASEYDSAWIKGVSYGGAAIVGFARVHHKAHFASDVTAGAILGTAVGRTVVRINRTERGKLALAPVSGPHGEPGMAVVVGF